jgi:hypothetical protein
MAPAPGSPRAVVADALAVTGYPIVSGRWPTQISEPTLVIATRDIRPGPVQGNLTWGLAVYVLSALTTDAEDDLEVALLKVVDALAAAQPLVLVLGTRTSVADETYNAFGLDVEVYTPVPA